MLRGTRGQWAERKQSYQHTHQRTDENFLLYVRAFGRVLVDEYVTHYNSCLNATADPVTITISGSTNITSDYDVSLAGPCALDVTYDIEQAFHQKVRLSLAAVTDTNLYPTPWLRYATHVRPPVEMLLVSSEVDDELSTYLPLPVQATDIRAEIRAAMARYSNAVILPVVPCDMSDAYHRERFYRAGKQFYEYAYGHQIVRDRQQFWACLHEAQRLSPDALHTMSAMVVVVVMMQRQSLTAATLFNSIHYTIAVVENMACLAEHGMLRLVNDRVHVAKSADSTKYLNTSKYVLRIAYAARWAYSSRVSTMHTISDDEYTILTDLYKKRADHDILETPCYASFRAVLFGSIQTVMNEQIALIDMF